MLGSCNNAAKSMADEFATRKTAGERRLRNIPDNAKNEIDHDQSKFPVSRTSLTLELSSSSLASRHHPYPSSPERQASNASRTASSPRRRSAFGTLFQQRNSKTSMKSQQHNSPLQQAGTTQPLEQPESTTSSRASSSVVWELLESQELKMSGPTSEPFQINTAIHKDDPHRLPSPARSRASLSKPRSPRKAWVPPSTLFAPVEQDKPPATTRTMRNPKKQASSRSISKAVDALLKKETGSVEIAASPPQQPKKNHSGEFPVRNSPPLRSSSARPIAVDRSHMGKTHASERMLSSVGEDVIFSPSLPSANPTVSQSHCRDLSISPHHEITFVSTSSSPRSSQKENQQIPLSPLIESAPTTTSFEPTTPTFPSKRSHNKFRPEKANWNHSPQRTPSENIHTPSADALPTTGKTNCFTTAMPVSSSRPTPCPEDPIPRYIQMATHDASSSQPFPRQVQPQQRAVFQETVVQTQSILAQSQNKTDEWATLALLEQQVQALREGLQQAFTHCNHHGDHHRHDDPDDVSSLGADDDDPLYQTTFDDDAL